MSQQLVKKGANGRMEHVNPRSWIDAIKDKYTGQSLLEILQGFNMYFISYTGDDASTRLQVPVYLRKRGLWIVYEDYNDEVIVEWYNEKSIKDDIWKLDSSWNKVPLSSDIRFKVEDNVLYISYNKEKDWEYVGVLSSIYADEEDLTLTKKEGSLVLKIKNRDSSKGKGYVILRTEESLTEQMSQSNTIYAIRYHFDLNGEIFTIPEGCTLDFIGGSISNGTIIGNNSIINSTPYEILKNINIEGSWNISFAYSEWFGAKSDGITDDSIAIQKCIDSFGMCNLLAKNYYIWNHIVLKFKNQLLGESKGSTIINANNDDEAIRFTHHGCCERFTINIINESLKCGIRYLLTESNTYQSVIRDIEIRYPTWCAEGTIGLSLESRYGVGVFMLTVDNVDVKMADVAFNFHSEKDTDATPICWINTNYINSCRAWGCNTMVKMTCIGVCDIQGNFIDVSFQNATHLSALKPVYDIGDNLRIFDNKFKGYLWDLDINMSYGSLLGNVKNNKVENFLSPYFYSSGADKYYLIGTLADMGTGYASVELNLTRFNGEDVSVKIVKGSNATYPLTLSYYRINGGIDSGYNFYTILKDGVYYIYVKGLQAGYTNIKYNKSSWFTPNAITHPLTDSSLIDSLKYVYMEYKEHCATITQLTSPKTNKPNGTINIVNGIPAILVDGTYKTFQLKGENITPTLDFPLTVANRIYVESLDGIFGEIKTEGWHCRYGYSDSLGITSSEVRAKVILLIYNNGLSVDYKNTGSFVIAISVTNSITFTVKKTVIFDGSWESDWELLHCSENTIYYLQNKKWGKKFTNNLPVFNNGTDYIMADGTLEGTLKSGVTSNRPTVSENKIYIGFEYFDTSLGCPIWHKGSDVWVNSNGEIV